MFASATQGLQCRRFGAGAPGNGRFGASGARDGSSDHQSGVINIMAQMFNTVSILYTFLKYERGERERERENKKET